MQFDKMTYTQVRPLRLKTDDSAVSAAASAKPNILHILLDDWGWADAGWHRPPGYKDVQSPNMDALVKEGVPPDMWEPYKSGGKDGKLKKNPIVKAFQKAMDLCFEKDPKQRGTSIQVARVLHKALLKEEMSRQQIKEQAEKEEESEQQ